VIYFIEAVGAGLLKIGFTDRDPLERLRELQTGCPHTLRLLGTCPGTQADERQFHELWATTRTTGEWFRIDDRLRWFLGWLEYGEKVVTPFTDPICAQLMRLEDRVTSVDDHYFARLEQLSLQVDELRRQVEAADRRHSLPPRPPTFADCRM
jgi:hypothetical protein